MSQKPPRPERSGPAPLARTYLEALTRLQDRTVPSPSELTGRAEALLNETFGLSESVAEAAFSHGVLGLMSEHTHYFNGFAVLMPVAHGSAVAVRTTHDGRCRCAFENRGAAVLERNADDITASVVASIFEALRPPGTGIEMAVVGSNPEWWWEVNLTSLGVASARAMQALFSRADESIELMTMVRAAIEAALRLPFSIAYPIAAIDGRPGTPVLVDTETNEYLMLGSIDAEEVGWGAVHVSRPIEPLRSGVHERLTMVAEALARLQQTAFPHLASFRDLEHRDLERALDSIPASCAPVVRYLVTENRRVQKLVAALRRRDWQMLGALMLMSHAVQRDDWKMSSEADFVVSQVEGMSLEGLYGARMSGRSGTVVVAGQPYVIPNFIDRMQSELQDRIGVPAETLLL